jgi:hypothetical protein
MVKGEMISYPLPERVGDFYRPSQWSDNYKLITFSFRRRFTWPVEPRLEKVGT